jgi:hypothetical protein
MKLVQLLTILIVFFGSIACNKSRLPGIEFTVKLDGKYLDDLDTINHYHEGGLNLLRDTKYTLVIVSNGQTKTLAKSPDKKVSGNFGLYRQLNSDNDAFFIQRYWIDVDGQYEKKSNKVKINGSYSGVYTIIQSIDGDKVSIDYPYWGTFEIEPKN